MDTYIFTFRFCLFPKALHIDSAGMQPMLRIFYDFFYGHSRVSCFVLSLHATFARATKRGGDAEGKRKVKKRSLGEIKSIDVFARSRIHNSHFVSFSQFRCMRSRDTETKKKEEEEEKRQHALYIRQANAYAILGILDNPSCRRDRRYSVMVRTRKVDMRVDRETLREWRVYRLTVFWKINCMHIFYTAYILYYQNNHREKKWKYFFINLSKCYVQNHQNLRTKFPLSF